MSGDVILDEPPRYWAVSKSDLTGSDSYIGPINPAGEPTAEDVRQAYGASYGGGRYKLVPVYDTGADDSGRIIFTLAEFSGRENPTQAAGAPSASPGSVTPAPTATPPSAAAAGVGVDPQIVGLLQQLIASQSALQDRLVQLEKNAAQPSPHQQRQYDLLDERNSSSQRHEQQRQYEPQRQFESAQDRGVSTTAELLKALAPVLTPRESSNGNHDMLKFMITMQGQAQTQQTQLLATLLPLLGGKNRDDDDEDAFERMARKMVAAKTLKDLANDNGDDKQTDWLDVMDKGGDKLLQAVIAMKDPKAFAAMRQSEAAALAREDSDSAAVDRIDANSVAEFLSDPAKAQAFFGTAKSADALQSIKTVLDAHASPEDKRNIAKQLGLIED
jgi:hypothetical protein